VVLTFKTLLIQVLNRTRIDLASEATVTVTKVTSTRHTSHVMVPTAGHRPGQ